MRDFDWNILDSLYQTKNITKSAELLFMTQPALTKRLQAIEEELGCAVVIRTRRGVSFTPEGEEVVKKAQIIISAIRDIKQGLAGNSGGRKEVLSLGVPYSFVRFVLPALLEQYVKLYPDVDIRITTTLSDDLLRQVQDGSLDVCFARMAQDSPLLVKRQVSVDQIYAVYYRPFEIEDLPNLPYIEFQKNEITYLAGRTWWEERFDTPQKIRFLVHNGDTCLSMIQHGLGYGIFPDSQYFMNDKSLYSIPLELKDGTQFTRSTWLIYQKSILKKAAAANFIRFLDGIDINQLRQKNRR